MNQQPEHAEAVDIGMFESRGEEESGFHVYNVAPNQYHRSEALQRTGAIDIQCTLEKKKNRRISEATIELTFEPGVPGGSDVEIRKISFDDVYSLMPTTQQETTTVGLEANIGAGAFGAEAGFGAKWEKSVSVEVSDAITLSGGAHVVDNRPPKRKARWVLYENATQPAGIPTSLTTAVLVSRMDEELFHCNIDFSCKTDLKTKAWSYFKKIPYDDPIIFQPNEADKGTRPNENVVYDMDDDLGKKDLGEFCDVTYRVEMPRT